MFIASNDSFIPGNVDVRCCFRAAQETDGVEGNLKFWTRPDECAAYWFYLCVNVRVCMCECACVCACVSVHV